MGRFHIETGFCMGMSDSEFIIQTSNRWCLLVFQVAIAIMSSFPFPWMVLADAVLGLGVGRDRVVDHLV
ncbi:hypothetical protein [Lyngbya sp. CCY1209]|uniref:hypothetical protein n=1 Tax=Lyngbya sp. CCY1209 TaxID=2886103 RepID=UPI002D21087C|nr:hypothetical protein [Lyngbya sp. CCY1209]MEB3886141.1 hypothetical protein [Lyngbya sp. CCY1209]